MTAEAPTKPVADPVEDPAPAETPAEPAKEPEAAADKGPDLAAIATGVMARRDASQLGALVREKKALEAEKAKFKEHEADLGALAEFHRLYEVDPAAAVAHMLEHKEGKDKGQAALARAYDGLTTRILGVESKTAVPPHLKLSVDRAEKNVSGAQARIDALEAKLAAKEAEEQRVAVQGALQTVGGFLTKQEHEYRYLMAEADDPTEIVWSIMEDANAQGVELSLGDAAALANEHFKPTFEKKKDRYQRLTAPERGADTPSKPESTPKPSASTRKSLTNADASQATAPTTTKQPPPKTDEERLERSWQMLKERSQKLD